jgi:hypothetical protein
LVTLPRRKFSNSCAICPQLLQLSWPKKNNGWDKVFKLEKGNWSLMLGNLQIGPNIPQGPWLPWTMKEHGEIVFRKTWAHLLWKIQFWVHLPTQPCCHEELGPRSFFLRNLGPFTLHNHVSRRILNQLPWGTMFWTHLPPWNHVRRITQSFSWMIIIIFGWKPSMMKISMVKKFEPKFSHSKWEWSTTIPHPWWNPAKLYKKKSPKKGREKEKEKYLIYTT